jgi:uncharacterized membrane protein YoaK (UPF0700 family)
MVQELDRRRLLTATALSAVAGWVDAIAFVAVGGYFVSFMSGNTTRGAVDASRGGPWWIAVALVLAFVAGVVAGSILQRVLPARPESAALGLVVVLLAAAALTADRIPVLPVAACLAAAMGAVNVIFTRDRQVSFGVTYMTGALVKAAQGAVGQLWGERGTGWWRYLVLWGAIVAGALGGALASAALGLAALWLALAAATLLLVVTLARRR